MPSDKIKKKGSHQVGTQNKNALKLHADAKEFVPSSVSNVGSWFPRHFLSHAYSNIIVYCCHLRFRLLLWPL